MCLLLFSVNLTAKYENIIETANVTVKMVINPISTLNIEVVNLMHRII